ncbi:beta-galactoside alpha-2,6-sialyltransferase 1 [Asbolus verrucosus]|uniref:Beta-galactoside alpha-2,6-sialyltransferase 1 n=1 Tax=Asbolus verrucosus TaxID=1661398 RepID=A0A482VIN8_ASBVE|nr:beta-galactoside alpha-2,6-sialyltransferase 1 [Asbolus verrucosus]
MRALVVSIWVFINLVFFGMCGYMYLLWSQYWMFMERQTGTTTSTYDQQIYYYNRGYLPSDTNKTHHNTSESKLRIKHSLKENVTVTLIKNSRPRFPNLQSKDFELDTKKYSCFKNDTKSECAKKSSEFKSKLLKELRRVLEDEGNVLKSGTENPYNVQYEGARGNFHDKTPKQIMCELRKIKIKTLKRGDVRGGPSNIGDFLPKRGLFENRKFNSCAIVASAGSLKDSNLGKTIDAHDLVLRFNHAPTKGFEEDVGAKTTVRVLNSQVITREEFKFLQSDIYKNLTVVAWDPSVYKATLEEWLEKPEFNLFPAYVEYKRKNDKARIFLINPQSLWELWDFLQGNSPGRLRRNPLSSGFLGLGLLLPLCNFVDIFEYVPSARVTKRCHYYDPEDNPACTFGVWHPLAAEKLLTYHINTADDHIVFQNGYVRIPGFKNFKC